jgi:hypothetical protein
VGIVVGGGEVGINVGGVGNTVVGGVGH